VKRDVSLQETLQMKEEQIVFDNVEEENGCMWEEKDYFHKLVVMHNLKGYDGHFIIKNFSKETVEQGDGKCEAVDTTAVNSETFISFDINYMRFIDSVQFLKALIMICLFILDVIRVEVNYCFRKGFSLMNGTLLRIS
jgi:hypothetical protein